MHICANELIVIGWLLAFLPVAWHWVKTAAHRVEHWAAQRWRARR